MSKEPNLNLLPLRFVSDAVIGAELARLRVVLVMEGVAEVPPQIFAKKYFRARLGNGQMSGTVSSSVEVGDRRRVDLVRVRSHVLQTTRRGRRPERVPMNMYGALHRYAVIIVAGELKTFAYIESVRSVADRSGAYGLPEKRRDTECFCSLGGTMRYVDSTSIDAVLGSLLVRERRVVMYTRQVFTSEYLPRGHSTPALALRPSLAL